MTRDISYAIATRHATELVLECQAAGISWPETALTCESVIAIVVASAAISACAADPVRFSAEIIDLMTAQAHKRVTALILKVPYNG